MGFGFKSFLRGLRLIPVFSTTVSEKGDLEVLDSSGKMNYYNGSSASPVVTESHTATLTNKSLDGNNNTFTNIPAGALPANTATTNTTQTFTNKTIDADANTITNIEDAEIKTGASINRGKMASGTPNHVVTNDGSGVFSSEAQLALSRGGTGQSTALAAFNALSPSTTKGDLIVNNGIDDIRLPVGTNSQVLTANSATASGLEWTNSAVADNSINEFKLTTSVAGDGLTGGNGTPLSVVVDNSTIEIDTDVVQVKDGGITRSKLEAVGQQISAGCGNFSTTSGSYVDITNLNVSITTTGRPIIILLISDREATGDSKIFNATGFYNLQLFQDGYQAIAAWQLGDNAGAAGGVTNTSSFVHFYVPSAGTYTFRYQINASGGGITLVDNFRMVAWEL